MDSCISSKILRRNREHKPWVSWQVQTLLHKSKTLFQRQRRTGKVRDIRHYEETKAQLQKAERQSYWQFVDNIREVGDPDKDQQPKQKIFWSYIKSIRKDTGWVAPLKENGRLHAEPRSTFSKNSLGIPSDCQTVWTQIRPDNMSGLIWVQFVCKDYQQTIQLDTVKNYSLFDSRL